MKIDRFIKEFKDAEDKTAVIQKHLNKEKYLPYERKIVICKNIIESADYTPNVEIADKKYYCPNTPMRFLFFCMSIIEAYTNIDLDETENGKDVIGGYNKLDKNGVFEILFRELDREYTMLNTILQMMVEDTINKENNMVGFLTTKFDSVKALYDATLPILEEKITEYNKNS